MRAMGISDIETFPFPTPPPLSSIKRAVWRLLSLGALIYSNYKE